MRKDEEARHADLVCRMFEAAVEPRRWSGLGAELAHAFDADSASLVLLGAHAATSYLDLTENLTGKCALAYEQYYRQRDVWAMRASQPGRRGGQLGSDLIGDSEFARTEFYTDFCRGAGLFHALGCVVPLSATEFGLLAIHRPRSGSAFSLDEQQRLNLLIPYFERALRLRARLRGAGAQGAQSLPGLPDGCGVQALDCLDTAVFLVDAGLRLLHANAAASVLLGRDTALRLQAGVLLQQDCGGALSLARVVRAALDPAHLAAAPQSLCVARRGRQPLLLTVAPFLPPAGLPWLQPCAIVMARDPEAHRLSRSSLAQLFGLTPAEAGVAQALAHGDAPEDIAAALDVSVHTVKTHLQRLFRKTGTRRQGELVALLHGSPASAMQADDGAA